MNERLESLIQTKLTENSTRGFLFREGLEVGIDVGYRSALTEVSSESVIQGDTEPVIDRVMAAIKALNGIEKPIEWIETQKKREIVDTVTLDVLIREIENRPATMSPEEYLRYMYKDYILVKPKEL